MTLRRRQPRRPAPRIQLFRLLSPVAGCAILYHEVWLTQSSEIILVLLGLWLIGAPIAQFVDVLNRAGKFGEQIEGYHDEAQKLHDHIEGKDEP